MHVNVPSKCPPFYFFIMPQAANEETKEHLYETLLAECRDTIQAVREELKAEAVRKTSWSFISCASESRAAGPATCECA